MTTLPTVSEARLPAFRPVPPKLQSREEVYLRDEVPFKVTLNFGAANTDKVVALVSFTSIIKVVFVQMFGIDVSMITVSFVEVTSASAILIAFSSAGSGLSMSTISGSSTRMTGPLNQEFCIHLGQEGIQVSNACWKLFCLEHDIQLQSHPDVFPSVVQLGVVIAGGPVQFRGPRLQLMNIPRCPSQSF